MVIINTNSELSSNTTVLAWHIMKYMCKVNIKDIPPVKISILLKILTLENIQKKITIVQCLIGDAICIIINITLLIYIHVYVWKIIIRLVLDKYKPGFQNSHLSKSIKKINQFEKKKNKYIPESTLEITGKTKIIQLINCITTSLMNFLHKIIIIII